LERGIAVRQGLPFLRAELPRILAAPPDVLSPRMVRVIEDLAGDRRRLDERIESLSGEIEAVARQDAGAWGIENSAYIHARTPPDCRERNILGDARQMPFPDGSFDFVYETCLCYLAEEDVETAIRELFRVCRIGVFMGGITSDMMPDVIEQFTTSSRA
jgi:SAM-dependent methyltransferase